MFSTSNKGSVGKRGGEAWEARFPAADAIRGSAGKRGSIDHASHASPERGFCTPEDTNRKNDLRASPHACVETWGCR